MPNSPNLALPYLVATQAQKELTHNDALNALDALVQPRVASRTLNAPPTAPDLGALYIVGASPTGLWSGYAGALAAWYQGWQFRTPRTGWSAFVIAENRFIVFDGTTWVPLTAIPREATLSWNPGTLVNGAGITSPDIALSGAALGEYVSVAPPYDLQGILMSAWVGAAGIVRIRLHNATGTSRTLAAGTWNVRVSR